MRTIGLLFLALILLSLTASCVKEETTAAYKGSGEEWEVELAVHETGRKSAVTLDLLYLGGDAGIVGDFSFTLGLGNVGMGMSDARLDREGTFHLKETQTHLNRNGKRKQPEVKINWNGKETILALKTK